MKTLSLLLAGFLASSVQAATLFSDSFEGAAHALGGTVSGLTGSGLVLQLDIAGSTVTRSISSNGGYLFIRNNSIGENYTVNVQTQATGQTCAVSNGNGVVADGGYMGIDVSCYTATGTESNKWDQMNWDEGVWADGD